MPTAEPILDFPGIGRPEDTTFAEDTSVCTISATGLSETARSDSAGPKDDSFVDVFARVNDG